MSRLKNAALISFALILSNSAFADLYKDIPKVVYGEDNRYRLANHPVPIYKVWARSTAAMIEKSKLKTRFKDKTFLRMTETLSESLNVCKNEKFADELTAASCSGFLVAPDVLITAGHCIKSQSDCRSGKWVFDYRADKVSRKNKFVLNKNIYSCKKILSAAYDKNKDLDFSVIKLDRPVEDRAPLKIRQFGKVEDNADLVVIGHPSGLPTIIADNGIVLKNSKKNTFSANLDTFSVNSGSAVINSDTGEVEGILVRGQQDYERDRSRGCLRVNVWDKEYFPGEHITRIGIIKVLKDLGLINE